MGLLDKFFGKPKVNIDDRFDKLREAVSGTMSSFYMARDREQDRVVGLKVGIREKVEGFESRFRGLKKPPEGQIAMKFHSPLIVETYEYGMTTTNLPYIVMEYLEGPGLQQLLYTRDRILDGKRTRIIRQMAEALQIVHAEGYIHRDICPRNFIASTDCETIKLIDFGLTLPNQRDFCQPGNRTGTPIYMAPEVVRRRWTDQRLDIFALGVTAYHVCAMELPWSHGGETTGQAALAHDTTPPRDIFELRPTLNRALGKAIMKCLQPEPARRTQTIELFLRDIRQVENDDEPT